MVAPGGSSSAVEDVMVLMTFRRLPTGVARSCSTGKYFCETGRVSTRRLKKVDHPELDMSAELDANGIKDYGLLIGTLQWSVFLQRIDITTAVMTMSGFSNALRKGHLEQVQHIISYLVKMKHGAIRFHTEEPDLNFARPAV